MGQSDGDFCEQLARKVGVCSAPGSSFYSEPINNIIRLHFAKKDETLYAALDRLSHIKDLMYDIDTKKNSLPLGTEFFLYSDFALQQ